MDSERPQAGDERVPPMSSPRELLDSLRHGLATLQTLQQLILQTNALAGHIDSLKRLLRQRLDEEDDADAQP